jgi:hypothetical protein
MTSPCSVNVAFSSFSFGSAVRAYATKYATSAMLVVEIFASPEPLIVILPAAKSKPKDVLHPRPGVHSHGREAELGRLLVSRQLEKVDGLSAARVRVPELGGHKQLHARTVGRVDELGLEGEARRPDRRNQDVNAVQAGDGGGGRDVVGADLRPLRRERLVLLVVHGILQTT